METLDEVAHEIAHATMSLDVRSQGRLRLVRATHPPHLDAEAVERAVRGALLEKGVGHVHLAWVVDPGPARVLGGVTEDRCRR
jgi:hypothetical protein